MSNCCQRRPISPSADNIRRLSKHAHTYVTYRIEQQAVSWAKKKGKNRNNDTVTRHDIKKPGLRETESEKRREMVIWYQKRETSHSCQGAVQFDSPSFHCFFSPLLVASFLTCHRENPSAEINGKKNRFESRRWVDRSEKNWNIKRIWQNTGPRIMM